MTLVSNLSDDIPGLLKAALIFNGETPGGKSASLAILTDGDAETLIDLSAGLNARGDGLTQAMRSYISGLSQVGQVLKARKIEDEDGVTEDDLERAALLFAFPKVGQNAKALTILKAHLDALQDHGIVAKADGSSPVAKPKPKVEARQEPDQDASDDAEADQTDDDETVIEQVAEAASPLTLVGGGAAAAVAAVLDKDDAASDDEDDDTEMSADADETEDVGDEEEEEVSASADDTEVEADDEGDDEEEEDAVRADAPPRPSPAQIAQARLNNAPRKPSFFGR